MIAAGYALYSSATMLVLSWGSGVHGFTLDSGVGEFVLTHPAMHIPVRGEELYPQQVSPAWLGCSSCLQTGINSGRFQSQMGVYTEQVMSKCLLQDRSTP